MSLGRMKTVLINPNVVVQRHDLFTTGIIYMPISLAYFAAALKEAQIDVQVVDAFGEEPNRCLLDGDLMYRGLPPEEVARRISPDTRVAVLYAGQVANHLSLIRLLRTLRSNFPKMSLVVMENTQAVTAYSLRQVQSELYDAGADFIITGEAEERGRKLVEAIAAESTMEVFKQLDGIGLRRNGLDHYLPPTSAISDLDRLPRPAWDLFPLKNYWALRYAHGPMTHKRYLPMLTSRGCPYPCRFCVIPETNSRKWRARSADNVVDEMQHFYETMGVNEFHIEDVDPTIDDGRTRRICQVILERRLPVTWKLCAGTKVESLRDEETLVQMAQAGCRYISISPESGSERMLRLMTKPFDIEHARRLIRKMGELGIRSQACFVLGYPGEEDADREMTLDLVKDLSRFGVDEIAVFVITPIPGSAIYDQFKGFDSYSDLTFSPTWRSDYKMLNRWRLRLYRTFLWNKLTRHPFKLLAQPFRFLFRHFETKMEMVPYRALHAYLLQAGILGERS
jgi:anaerobic magnesium-protoporphyrin IX monomethyl ester cyclase